MPTEAAITKAAEAELDSLVFDASLKGPLARPRVNGSLKAAGLRAQGSALDRIETRFSAEPAGPDPNASRFALSADARVEGLLLADPALRRAIGSRARSARPTRSRSLGTRARTTGSGSRARAP